MSCCTRARSRSGPMLGRFITVATIRLPENSWGRYQPIVLTRGLMATRTGYFTISRHSESPLARAVTTYGLWSSSSRLARMTGEAGRPGDAEDDRRQPDVLEQIEPSRPGPRGLPELGRAA